MYMYVHTCIYMYIHTDAYVYDSICCKTHALTDVHTRACTCMPVHIYSTHKYLLWIGVFVGFEGETAIGGQMQSFRAHYARPLHTTEKKFLRSGTDR